MPPLLNLVVSALEFIRLRNSIIKAEALPASAQATSWNKITAIFGGSTPDFSQVTEVVRVKYEIPAGENVEQVVELLMKFVPQPLQLPLLTHVSVVYAKKIVGMVLHPSGAVRSVSASYDVDLHNVVLTLDDYSCILDPVDVSLNASPNNQELECHFVVVSLTLPDD